MNYTPRRLQLAGRQEQADTPTVSCDMTWSQLRRGVRHIRGAGPQTRHDPRDIKESAEPELPLSRRHLPKVAPRISTRQHDVIQPVGTNPHSSANDHGRLRGHLFATALQKAVSRATWRLGRSRRVSLSTNVTHSSADSRADIGWQVSTSGAHLSLLVAHEESERLRAVLYRHTRCHRRRRCALVSRSRSPLALIYFLSDSSESP